MVHKKHTQTNTNNAVNTSCLHNYCIHNSYNLFHLFFTILVTIRGRILYVHCCGNGIQKRRAAKFFEKAAAVLLLPQTPSSLTLIN
jgi:hypothetical protein